MMPDYTVGLGMKAIWENCPRSRLGKVEGCPAEWMEKYREGWAALRSLT